MIKKTSEFLQYYQISFGIYIIYNKSNKKENISIIDRECLKIYF